MVEANDPVLLGVGAAAVGPEGGHLNGARGRPKVEGGPNAPTTGVRRNVGRISSAATISRAARRCARFSLPVGDECRRS